MKKDFVFFPGADKPQPKRLLFTAEYADSMYAERFFIFIINFFTLRPLRSLRCKKISCQKMAEFHGLIIRGVMLISFVFSQGR